MPGRPRNPGAFLMEPDASIGVLITDNAGMNWLDEVKWDAAGLVPVIAQELDSGDVLMFAWMNREALEKTV